MAKEETITIRLPLTRTEKEALWVGINGDSWLIQRGVAVEVPRAVYEVLDRREQMQREAMAYDEKHTL